MKKVFRRRVSSWTVLGTSAAISLVVAGLLALNRPLPEYLVARGDLHPGERVTIENFHLMRLDLATAGAGYLTSADMDESYVVSQVILGGELLPSRSLSSADVQGLTTLVLESSLPVSEKITPGTWVQIWRTTSTALGMNGELLISRSEVASVIQDESLGSIDQRLVEVLVTQEQASLLIESIAAEMDLYLLVAT